jgi:glutathione S-transferase
MGEAPAVPIVHGGLPSPFVKKVCAFLAEKGVAYELRPLSPFPKTPELMALSPLGKIPIYQDGDFTLTDSSAICAYVERVQPEPSMYPAEPRAYGRALFLEEFADTKLAEVLGGVFFQRVIRPRFFAQPPDEAAIAKSLAEAMPPVLDWVESQLGNGALGGGAFGIAEVAAAAQLANFRLAGEKVDAARWPRLAAFADRALTRPSFATLIEGGAFPH